MCTSSNTHHVRRRSLLQEARKRNVLAPRHPDHSSQSLHPHGTEQSSQLMRVEKSRRWEPTCLITHPEVLHSVLLRDQETPIRECLLAEAGETGPESEEAADLRRLPRL